MYLNKTLKYSSLSDDNLLKLIKEDNQKAFTELYYRHSPMLFSLSLRYLKDQMMAEDAVQHSFVKLWEAREKISITKNVRNYLYTLTKNHILNQIRNNNKIIAQNYQEAQMVETSLSEASIEKEETIEKLYNALEQLPKTKKEVCLLKMQEYFSNKEIAEILNISVSTVKTHFAQSKEILKLQLKKTLFFIIFIILL